jgi:hypothetical protein
MEFDPKRKLELKRIAIFFSCPLKQRLPDSFPMWTDFLNIPFPYPTVKNVDQSDLRK